MMSADEHRIVRKTTWKGRAEVSTIYEAFSYDDGKRVRYFETMVFGGGPFDGWARRDETETEAMQTHARALGFIRRGWLRRLLFRFFCVGAARVSRCAL